MTGEPAGYILATRIFRGPKKFRTRYYLGCVDGRPRVGHKKDAPRFDYETATTIARQLQGFIAFLDNAKPPRAAAWPAPRAKPEQPQFQ